MTDLVIIGSGLAGYTLAREFRKRDQDSTLTIICADDGASYSKPMLSNAVAKDKTPDALIMADAEKMAADLNADIKTGTTVTAIDRQHSQLHTSTGSISYGKLVIATGANPIAIPFDGNAADRVMMVNNLTDYRQFHTQLTENKRVVIIGAGLIGCEFANDLSTLNMHIDIVDLASSALGRLLPNSASTVLQEKLSNLGVNWHLQNSVTAIDRNDDDSLHVSLKDGSAIDTDIVLSAIGLRADIQLCKQAEIDTDRGIKVDRFCQSSDDNIYALGDCAQVEDLNLPFVMPLMTCARALAATLTGEPTAVNYPAMPVVVKTPCYPVVVCPPPRPVEGSWEDDITDEGIRSLYKDSEGNTVGFALTDGRVKERMGLAKEIPGWL